MPPVRTRGWHGVRRNCVDPGAPGPCRYQPCNKERVRPVDQPQIGFIALDLEKVLPEAEIAPSGEGSVYSAKESALIPVLVEAIKAQQKEIDEFEGSGRS